MAKDYFQDILPPGNSGRKGPRAAPRRDPDVRPHAAVDETVPLSSLDSDEDEVEVPSDLEPTANESTAPERSIRNISAPSRRVRDDLSDAPRYSPPMPTLKKRRRRWLWIVAAVFVVILAILIMISLRGTSVSVEPRTHTVVFDETSRFTAYPQQNAPQGSLAYTTQTIDLEDSEPVESSGTTHVEEKASGTITVFNAYSAAPVKLVKNTRFQNDAGLIFRAPSDIVVPGKTAAGPGKITVTVVADAPGEQYNIQPSKLTVPGLKGSAEFDQVYAQVTAAFTGGFSGERPAIADSSLAAARTAVRSRLEQKMREQIVGLSTGSNTTFPELARITYTDLPTTTETAGGARIHEKATALVPLIASADFAGAVAHTVSAEADGSGIRMVGIKDFGGLLISASSTPGVDPIQFQLTGQALLIWDVNAADLAQALAGRDQSAFQTIVTGFPGIQSATARIEPFWSSTFPGDASNIRVKINDPAPGSSQQ